ncbi:nitrite reductase/ring-hydroxylating ferredoxin subunit [Actinomadura pelletieri DSM 43383]|uniref:Nitrite reductase/ring-hydroxylating ferredoxin subunit n=1 Tax=Actinomadura pelletieri DSM 43383 TaxID=1120940 RepID=A0A495QL33_9ACTN|nr:Rieske (2Fe-2S) protein [Actinomadura pelletieri]RKS73259.1 nitrite reductase/ring-hydroxylating ferredoxin subunit [Actinomadura pelletieri DSM 43383]
MPQGSETRSDGAEQAPGNAPAGGNSRRGLLIGAGLAGIAGLAAACGGSDDGGEAGDSTGSGGSTGGGRSNGGRSQGGGKGIAKTADIPVGGGKIFEDAKVVVCQPTQGQFKAFSVDCTHRGCAVGSVTGGTINCHCHGSKFKITDGSVAAPPADKPLPEKKITVQGDQIMLA